MWKRSGKFLALLAALLLFSSLGFSEEPEKVYYLTEAEFIQLKMVFAGLKTENEMLTQQLDELKKEAQGLKAESATLKGQLAEVQTSLTKASESLKAYAAGMNRTLWTERIKWGAGGLAAGIVATVLWSLAR